MNIQKFHLFGLTKEKNFNSPILENLSETAKYKDPRQLAGAGGLLIMLLLSSTMSHAQQSPCGSPVYRQFDFWVGEWEAFGVNGKKAGDSKISIILDSCVVLEEWTSAAVNSGIRYAGKSFNTYNAATNQWQQTWVDNAAGSNEYLTGKYGDNKIIFTTTPFAFSKDTMATRRLTFFNVNKDRVRQLGEITKDSGTTWSTEYDFEYRRKGRQ